jgi:hypothetical protein
MRDIAQVVNDQRREVRKSELSNIDNWSSSGSPLKTLPRVLFSCEVKKGVHSRRMVIIPGKVLLCKIPDDAEKNFIFDEQIDVNHLTADFSSDSLTIELHCHFKKYTHDISLTIGDTSAFNLLRDELQLELKFANPASLDNCSQVLPMLEKAKPAVRNSMVYFWDGIRKKKNFELYKTL